MKRVLMLLSPWSLVIVLAVLATAMLLVAVTPFYLGEARGSALQTLMTAAQMFGLLSIGNEIQRQIRSNARKELAVGLFNDKSDVLHHSGKNMPTTFTMEVGRSAFIFAMKNTGKETLKEVRVTLYIQREFEGFSVGTPEFGFSEDDLPDFVEGRFTGAVTLSKPIAVFIPGQSFAATVLCSRHGEGEAKRIKLIAEIAADDFNAIQKFELEIEMPTVVWPKYFDRTDGI